MTLSWTESRPTQARDAYLDWAALLAGRDPRPDPPGARFEPIFVRLSAGAEGRAPLVAALSATDGPLRMDAHERDFLEARLGPTDPYRGLADDYALYRRCGTPDSAHADLFEVIDTGFPVSVGPSAETPPAVAPLPASDKPGQPIVAVIDDAIGFLNARFCRADAPGKRRSRLHAIWLQALERGDPGGGVAAGHVLTRDAIDSYLAMPDEDAAYAACYARTFTPDSAAGLWRSSWHGTHVLDLAAGADPLDVADPARDWPLLAVQLPPEAIEDTSGMRAESYLVQGLRWILRAARQIDPTAPVIVNLSLGIVAGPKDGTLFAEWQVAREAAQWEAATGQRVRIVWAFGNAWRGNLVAAAELSARTVPDRAIDWRLQPEDRTANHLELRAHGVPSTALTIGLTAPDGTCSGLLPIPPGEMRSLERDGQPVARIYHLPDRVLAPGVIRAAHYVVVTAPTEPHALSVPAAPAGRWVVRLRLAKGAKARVTAQVQRDDSVRGNRMQARQSYLDGKETGAWDPVWHEHTGLAPDGPVCHAGTHSAFASIVARQVLSVGAARHDAESDAPVITNYRASDYSAEGGDWCAAGPSLGAVVDGGPFQPGIPGAHRRSGTVRRSNGTSAAAACVTRALALSADRIVQVGSAGTVMNDFDPARVTLIPIGGKEASRLGAAVLLPDSAPSVMA
ncbi:S8 family serine peptidase [Thetidibacter halocola]|uniref:Peptidase S8/S53 domain-containing protein n=1 Tax=Thetidibacter halocola TaxID=2827239 RepID=A0A8J7WGG4_9RHOB|nr:S8 family serine peptidase [Thetidibacter halocola]MBS0124838.1 hypothetical protein [Thetidibacter halocola]